MLLAEKRRGALIGRGPLRLGEGGGGQVGARARQIAVRYVSISAGRAGEAISNLLSIIFNIINPRHSIFHACAARPPSVRRVK